MDSARGGGDSRGCEVGLGSAGLPQPTRHPGVIPETSRSHPGAVPKPSRSRSGGAAGLRVPPRGAGLRMGMEPGKGVEMGIGMKPGLGMEPGEGGGGGWSQG